MSIGTSKQVAWFLAHKPLQHAGFEEIVVLREERSTGPCSKSAA